jgi:hypothetical protein
MEVVHENVADIVGDLGQLRELALVSCMELRTPQQDVLRDCEGAGKGDFARCASIRAAFG